MSSVSEGEPWKYIYLESHLYLYTLILFLAKE